MAQSSLMPPKQAAAAIVAAIKKRERVRGAVLVSPVIAWLRQYFLCCGNIAAKAVEM
jgi:pimeloyl-ACP methyl ester carboxylesterase